MRINEQGQITIPPDLQRQYGLLPNTEVELCEQGGQLWLRKQEDEAAKRKRIRGAIEGVSGSATAGFTTEEIMQMTRGED